MTEILSLVSTKWLAEHLNDANIKIIDATWDFPKEGVTLKDVYEETHILGALFFDIDEIADLDIPLPHMMPSNEKMEKRVQGLGINANDHVIVYDSSSFCTAARAWFMLKYYGHKKVSILDGGLSKWQSENRAVENKTYQIEKGRFTANLDKDKIRNRDQITCNIESAKEQVVDARAAGRFNGTAPEPRPGSKSGHIPGSFNVPFSTLLNDDKTYKSKAEIKNIFEKAGVDLSKPIITSCGSGVTACVVLFALEQIGHTQNALYDGSWSEWGTHPNTPVVK